VLLQPFSCTKFSETDYKKVSNQVIGNFFA